MTDKITIIDYNSGNLKSVCNMLSALCLDYCVSDNQSEISKAKQLIFPGQGHFGQAMKNLKSKGLDKLIPEMIENGGKFLGICIGLQILFEKSEEAPDESGLGIIKGDVVRYKKGKIPQIGWNKIKTTENNLYLADDYYYFVNSYYVKPENEDFISSKTVYEDTEFCSSVNYKNLTAVQFHPEKSAEAGKLFFEKWAVK